MNKKLTFTAAAVTLVAGGSAAAIANAQSPYNPYAPGTTTTVVTPGSTTVVVTPPPTTPTTPTTTTTVPPTTPACPSPATLANRAAVDIEDGLLQVRAARRTKIRVVINDTCPGVFTVRVYRRGTSVTLLRGTRTVKGTQQKPAKLTLAVTATGRAYFRRLLRADPERETVRTDLRVSYNPTAPGKTSVKRRVISVGLAGTDR
jgi:hypothetical protein